MGTVFTRRFEADRIGSQVPIKLMHLEGLYELFVSKFVSSWLRLLKFKACLIFCCWNTSIFNLHENDW